MTSDGTTIRTLAEGAAQALANEMKDTLGNGGVPVSQEYADQMADKLTECIVTTVALMLTSMNAGSDAVGRMFRGEGSE
jgi:hypothetical protein